MTVTNKKTNPVPFNPHVHAKGLITVQLTSFPALVKDCGKIQLRRLIADPNLAEWTVKV